MLTRVCRAPVSPEIISSFNIIFHIGWSPALNADQQHWDAIARIIQTYSPQECANYSAAAGYDAD